MCPCPSSWPPLWSFRRRAPRRVPAGAPPGSTGARHPTLDPLLRWKAHRWFDCLLDPGPGPGPRCDRRLTFHDYELAAERVARAFRRRPGCREHRRLHGCFRKLWRLHDSAGTGVQDRAAFTAGLAQALTGRHRALVAAVNSLCCAMVDLADGNGDNLLSEREYRVLLAAGFRLSSEHDLRTAYRTLDRDGSGALEHNEVHEAFVEFFTSADPDAPGNWLLGAPRSGDGGP